MKALAHPIRQRMLTEVRRAGEVTSTTLAQTLGVTTGNTSYNLRVLAEAGFVEEVSGRGNGRERWWRIVDQDVRFARHSEQDEATRAAFQEFSNLALVEDQEALQRFLRERDELGPWADALPFSRGSVEVTLGSSRSSSRSTSLCCASTPVGDAPAPMPARSGHISWPSWTYRTSDPRSLTAER